MLTLRRRSSILGPAFAVFTALPLAGTAAAQANGVVFSEIAVSGDEARLALETEGGETISVVFADGKVELDGEVIGEYPEGGDLERSWRSLLGEAASLEAERIPALIANWTPPAGLGGEVATVAERIRARLSLQGAAAPASALQDPGDGMGALRALMGRAERLRALADISDEIDTDPLRIHVGEDVAVATGETVESTLLVVDGGVRVDGTVNGDLVLLGADLALGPDARITGSVFYTDGDISGDLDAIEGEVDEIDSPSVDALVDSVARLREDAARERASLDNDESASPFRSIGRGLAGLLRTFVTFAIAFATGLGILYFFPRNLELVSRAARQSAGKSLLVGLAGLVLAIPLWVIGTVLLAISIIGIPLLLVWIPLFPVFLAAAVVLGTVAVARNLGAWVSSRDVSGGLDATRPALQVGTGLAVLLAAYVVANLFEMAGSWLGVFEGIFMFAAVIGCVLAGAVGLGAVILSRVGRIHVFAGGAPGTAGSGLGRGEPPVGL